MGPIQRSLWNSSLGSWTRNVIFFPPSPALPSSDRLLPETPQSPIVNSQPTACRAWEAIQMVLPTWRVSLPLNFHSGGKLGLYRVIGNLRTLDFPESLPWTSWFRITTVGKGAIQPRREGRRRTRSWKSSFSPVRCSRIIKTPGPTSPPEGAQLSSPGIPAFLQRFRKR